MINITSPLTQLDSATPQFEVGTRYISKDGNEYIYLPGVASCAQYDWVTYRAINATAPGMSYGSITRMVQGTPGFVGIAQAAITVNKYGWVQVAGIGWAKAAAVFSAGSPLYASGTTGAADTTAATLYNILPSFSIGTSVSGGTAKVCLDHPILNCAVL